MVGPSWKIHGEAGGGEDRGGTDDAAVYKHPIADGDLVSGAARRLPGVEGPARDAPQQHRPRGPGGGGAAAARGDREVRRLHVVARPRGGFFAGAAGDAGGQPEGDRAAVATRRPERTPA